MAVVHVLMSTSDQDPIGHRIIRLDSVDSTNNYAAKLLSSGELAHGSVIMADEQTAGRGQRGSSWSSGAGENLLLTIVLKPANLSVSEQFRLTQFASLALIDLLTKYQLNGAIKWPNDIYVNDLKLSGMLIENQVASTSVSTVLLGIGLNVNQNEFPGLEATSFCLETRERIQLMELAMSLFLCLNERWKAITNRQFKELDEAYRERLYLKDKPALYSDEEGEFLGTIIGTTEQGLLQLVRGNNVRTYDLKELRFIRRNDP